MKTRDLTVASACLIAICLCCLHAAQAQPTITSHGLLIAGDKKTLACSITSTETVSSYPLTWTRGGSPLVPSGSQTADGPGGSKLYNIVYTFTVSPSDNNVVLTCTASFPSGTTTATNTFSVYKGPDPPVVAGPSSVVSGVTSTWTCKVDGASHTAPNVYWEFGNRTRLPTNTFSNSGEVYRDSNNLEIHKQNSVLKLTLSTGAPNFILTCHAVHFDTNKALVSSIAVTVSPGPVTYLTSRSPQDESSTVRVGQITGLTSSSPQTETSTVTAGPATGSSSSSHQSETITASANEQGEADVISGSSSILPISLGIVGVVLTLVIGLGVGLVMWKKRKGKEESITANVTTGSPLGNTPANLSTVASNALQHNNSVPPSASSVGSYVSTSTRSAADSIQSLENFESVSEASEATEGSEASDGSEVSAFSEESEL